MTLTEDERWQRWAAPVPTRRIDGDTNATRFQLRAIAALEAYQEHASWEKAAEVAGYTNKGSAYRAVMGLLSRHVAPNAASMRSEANARHAQKVAMLEDVMYDLDRPMMERLRAADVHTRAEARSARLNGLDAPVQLALSSGVQAALQDALAEAEALLITGEVSNVVDLPAEEHQPAPLELPEVAPPVTWRDPS